MLSFAAFAGSAQAESAFKSASKSASGRAAAANSAQSSPADGFEKVMCGGDVP